MAIKNIIEELDKETQNHDKHLFVESKANHAIVAAINVLRLIDESFSDDEAEELRRRFINSVKSGDPRKFYRKIREMREDGRK